MTQILTPKGLVGPEEALHIFIARAECTAQQLMSIFSELCKKAVDFARRACAYVLREQVHYPVSVLKKAQDFAMRSAKKPSNGVEMVEKMNEMGLALYKMAGGKRKVSITFYDGLTTKVLQQVIENPLVQFVHKQEAAKLLTFVEINGWTLSNRTHVVTLDITSESNLWNLTGLLSEAAECVVKIKSVKS